MTTSDSNLPPKCGLSDTTPAPTDEINKPFFSAVYRGDWQNAKLFLMDHPDAVKARTPGLGKNALHIAVTEEHLHIVERLLEIMTEQDVEVERNDGFTALAAAIEVGNLPIARCLMGNPKSANLISIPNRLYRLPAEHAVITGQRHMVHYLYSFTPFEYLTSTNEDKYGSSLLSQCILCQHFDIALHLLERDPLLAITDDVPGRSPVFALAHSKVFASTCSLTFWQRWIYDYILVDNSIQNHISLDIRNTEDSQRGANENIVVNCLGIWQPYKDDIERIYKLKSLHVQSLGLLRHMCKVIESTSDEEKIRKAGVHDALIQAIHAGNVEFITSIVKANPDLVWNPSIARRVFQEAVECRQAKIFSLIYGLREKVAIVSFRDYNGNNMLHKATAVAPLRLLKLIPGPVLQMQSELQWFKAVEALASPAAREWTNEDCLKPHALFIESHKDLVVEGEKWMKDTAGSSIIVGALIFTVTFAAAFTFPRGNDQNSGYPIFVEDKFFKGFMMSNSVALFTSTTSVLMFLGIILTSRYGEEDFLVSLPKKLIIGLSTLFLSIAAMIIAFIIGISLMFHQRLWILVPSICLTCIPISFSVLMQFRLLVDIFMSTYGPGIFDKNLKRWI